MRNHKTEWTVRIVIHHEVAGVTSDLVERMLTRDAGRDSFWLGEALRYAGISERLAEFERPHREVFELRCPDTRTLDTATWADHNAARLRSFGLDATKAPRWTELTMQEQDDARRALVQHLR